MPSGSCDARTHFCWGETRDTTCDKILHELCEPDQREGNWHRGEACCGGTGRRIREPGNDVHPEIVEGSGIVCRCERVQNLICDYCEKFRDERLVYVVEALEFVKINFVCALTAEQCVDGGIATGGGVEQGRSMAGRDGFDISLLKSDEGLKIRGKNCFAYVTVKRGSDRVYVVDCQISLC